MDRQALGYFINGVTDVIRNNMQKAISPAHYIEKSNCMGEKWGSN